MAIPQPYIDAFETAFACRSSPCIYSTFPTSKESLGLFYGKTGETLRSVHEPGILHSTC